MIIIAGAGHIKSKKYRRRQSEHCGHCNNTSAWIMERKQHFITLFFLPVAPYKTEYVNYCPICNNGQYINKEQYEDEIRKGAQAL